MRVTLIYTTKALCILIIEWKKGFGGALRLLHQSDAPANMLTDVDTITLQGLYIARTYRDGISGLSGFRSLETVWSEDLSPSGNPIHLENDSTNSTDEVDDRHAPIQMEAE